MASSSKSERRLLGLDAFRPPGEVEQDLTWFYNLREGEMSHRSNYAAMVGRIEVGGRGGGGTPSRNYDSRQLVAAERERPIKAAIDSLPTYRRESLLYAYREQTLIDLHGRDAPERLEVYGALAGLVVVAPTSLKEHDASKRTMVEWLERVAKNARRYVTQGKLFNTITGEAEARLMDAAQAYERALRIVHRSGRYG